MRRLFLLGLISLVAQAVQVTTAADISGSSTRVQVAASGAARWVQFIAPSGNMGVSRYGDSSTSATRGGLLPAGSGQLLPPIPVTDSQAPSAGLYNLSALYVYVASGDTLTVVWGQ